MYWCVIVEVLFLQCNTIQRTSMLSYLSDRAAISWVCHINRSSSKNRIWTLKRASLHVLILHLCNIWLWHPHTAHASLKQPKHSAFRRNILCAHLKQTLTIKLQKVSLPVTVMTWLRGVLSGRGGVDLWPMDCIPIWFPKGFMPALTEKKRKWIHIYKHMYSKMQ